MKQRLFKCLAVFVVVNLIYQLGWPTLSYALTGGPSQPEVESFEPIGTSDMVDLFTGDFTYNIPLMDVEGYPLNIAYHSGISMDQEASWVGLGWNLNPGAITRNLRGLPDDFRGDSIKKMVSMKPNITWGIGGKVGLEFFGKEGKGRPGDSTVPNATLNLGLGIFSNNYRGMGYEFSVAPGVNIGPKGAGNLTVNLGFNSESGIDFSPDISYSKQLGGKESKGLKLNSSIGAPYNSRAGLKALTFGGGMQYKTQPQPKKNGDKRKAGSIKSGSHASLTFANPAYTPQVSMPFTSTNFNFRGTLGTEWGGTHPSFSLDGYYTKQRLTSNYDSIASYGYIYSHKGEEKNKVLLDFNREKDGVFYPENKFLPIPNSTYDVFSVTGQGVAGTFRPFRSDMGTVFDSYVYSGSSSGDLGIEVGLASYTHLGLDFKGIISMTSSGKWDDNNDASEDLQFRGEGEVADPLYEPCYFKNLGEKATIDQDYFTKIRGTTPIRTEINRDGASGNIKAEDVTETDQGSPVTIPAQNFRSSREKRNQVFSYLTAAEAAAYGHSKTIVNNYDIINNLFYGSPRINENAKSHHISEITVNNPDGSRYVYGIPAYNVKQKEYSFNINSGSINPNCATGLVDYDEGTDNSVGNTNGIDHFSSSTETPPYAHSFLLTSILSSDYVDVGNDGVTEDDLGTSINFKYTRASDNYKWRIPYDSANYDRGFISDNKDDQANYVYGEKEIWYLQSVESRNYIAVFTTSYRADGIEAAGQQGGQGSDTLKKLDKISLYSKQEFWRAISSFEDPVPIKEVHFVYDYDLCQGIPNGTGGGKLTLKRIYFTYQNSRKGKLSSYQFTYNNGNKNPDYNIKGYDRWGNYMPNRASSTCGYDETNNLTTSDYPYVNQDKDSADTYAQAWNLTKIDLPSGGEINIEYESDDYAYVQNKRAMQMLKIIGVRPDTNYALSSLNYLYLGDEINNVLFFDLPEGALKDDEGNTVTSYVEAKALMQRNYLNGASTMQNMYFKFYLSLKDGSKEFVPGFADIVDIGAYFSGGEFTKGWVKIAPTTMEADDGKAAHPISKTGWQFLRLNMPNLLFPSPNSDYTGSENKAGILQSMVNMAADVKTIFSGYNRYCSKEEYSRYFIKNKSWIRLYNPNKKKLGGGVRVKSITLKDHWGDMAGEENFEYTQEYDYTMEETEKDGSRRIISSGVAEYEPILGGDENPFYMPSTMKRENLLAPDDNHYQLLPVGESFFPAPSVGYRKVTVKNIEYTDVKRTATGFTVNEFYTAKEFPVIVNYTGIKPVVHKPNMIIKFLKFKVEDFMGASQGYVVELNDMHGRQKAQYIYSATNSTDPISGVEYYYKTQEENRFNQNPLLPDQYYTKLKNLVDVINPDGSVTQKIVGIDFDFVNDMRKMETFTAGAALKFNNEVIQVFGFPLPAFIPWPSYESQMTKFRSSVINKVFHRYGLLEKTVAFDLGSKIATENLAWDSETGNVLLTKTYNEFEDPIYNLTLPAHFAYEGMGMAYKNMGLSLFFESITNGIINISNPEDYFTPGDEVVINYRNLTSYFGFDQPYKVNYIKLWVYKDNGVLHFIDEKGALANMPNYAFPYTAKIIRSGRRNQQSNPIAEFTSLSNPISAWKIQRYDSVIASSAVEYSNRWRTFCNNTIAANCDLTDEIMGLPEIFDNLITHDRLTGISYSDHFNLDIEFTGLYQSYVGNHTNHYYWNEYNDTCWTGYLGDSSNYCEITLCADDPIDFAALEFTPWDFENVSIPEDVLNGPNSNRFNIALIYNNADTTILHGTTSCFATRDCEYTCGDIETGDTINPYLRGILGNWRQQRSYAFVDERSQTDNGGKSNIRKDGSYDSAAFWQYNMSQDIWINSNNPKYQWSSEVTDYSPYGFELENKDPLGIYTSAIYGLNHTFPIAVASNARRKHIAFDPFEDYDFILNNHCSNGDQWSFEIVEGVGSTTEDEAHSGKQSMAILAADSVSLATTLHDSSCTTPYPLEAPYVKKHCDCLEPFDPDTAREFILSAWIKESDAVQYSTYDDALIKIDYPGVSGVIDTFKASGHIIEGWQRVYGTFTLPTGATQVRVTLKASTKNAYFDDIRIFPFKGNMKTYVYDVNSLRLMAELDENNYATFYEYDEEGKLLRIKKETVKGVMTIQESRTSKSKYRAF